MSGLDNVNKRQLQPGFRMQTNMKAAPNSQGTLFQGGNAQRWPRGFTPQRRDDVVKAMQIEPDLLGGNKGEESYGQEMHTRPANARAVATIARSTVPIEHIEGTRGWFGQPSSNGNPWSNRENLAGEYHAYGRFGTKEEPWGDPMISVYRGHEHGTTAIHEIGHHVSQKIDKNWHSEAYEDSAAARGQEEGYAENYAERHYRDHRGRQLERLEGSRAENWAEHEGSREDASSFTRAFVQERERGGANNLRLAESIKRALRTPIQERLW